VYTTNISKYTNSQSKALMSISKQCCNLSASEWNCPGSFINIQKRVLRVEWRNRHSAWYQVTTRMDRHKPPEQ